MTKKETVELLQKQLPGFYSVEQVIKMINDIEDGEGTPVGFDSGAIAKLAENIADEIYNEGTNILDDYDLEMSYREVEVSSIDLNQDKMSRIIRDGIAEYIKDLEDSKEEE